MGKEKKIPEGGVESLKEELRECAAMMKSCRSLFDLAEEDDLIEARIYQMKSLSKHYDYLMGRIRRLAVRESPRREKTGVKA